MSIVVAAAAVLAILLSGCIGIKPGSYSLTQPAGVGAVNLRLTVCTLVVGELAPESKVPPIECGAPSEPGQGQMLATLVVPVGSATPESLTAAPGAGAAPTIFTRNPGLTAAMNATEFSPGVVGPPPGFEVAGYSSGQVSEPGGQELNWTIEGSIGLPPGAGGGSFGGPLKATVIIGWRNVTPGLPASRPINCEEEEPGTTICGGAQASGEATLGVSDLKIAPPATTTVVPGAKVTLPFVLDFASSAAALPTFQLALNTNLPGAGLRFSNSTFSRGPADPATGRAPKTTRKAIVQIPAGARLGSYELGFKATAGQGGFVTAATTLVVKPKGTAKVTVPRRVKAQIATGRGIPVRLVAPIADTRFAIALKGPGPSGNGIVRLRHKARTAREFGPIVLRLRVPRARAKGFLASGAPLRVEARINQPGTTRPKRLVRVLKLR